MSPKLEQGDSRNALFLPQSVDEQIRAHGEKAYPLECCGALLGRPGPQGWRIAAALRAGNASTDSAHHRFEIAAIELVHIEREARRRGLEIAGFYHSHPDHPAQWSAADFAGAHWLGCSYVIVEVAHARATAIHSFRLAGTTEEDKRFEPESVVVEDESSGGAWP